MEGKAGLAVGERELRGTLLGFQGGNIGLRVSHFSKYMLPCCQATMLSLDRGTLRDSAKGQDASMIAAAPKHRAS